MNKKLLVSLGVVGLLLGTAVGVLSWTQRQRLHFDQPAEEVATDILPRGQTTIRTILLDPFLLPKKADAAEEQGVPPECREFWRLVAESRLEDLRKEVVAMGWNRPEVCSKQQTFIDPRWEASILQSCANTGQPSTPERDAICLLGLANYRAQIVAFFTRDQNNYLDMPMALLVQKLIAQIAESEKATLPYSDLVQMLDAVKKREPDWYDGQKTVVAALFMRTLTEKDPDLMAQVTERFNHEIDQAVALNGQDPQILEIELFHQLQQGDEGRTEIERFVNSHSQSGVGHYYLAAAKCRVGDKVGCLDSLKVAIQRDAKAERFQQTLEKVSAASDVAKAEGLFSLQLSINLVQ